MSERKHLKPCHPIRRRFVAKAMGKKKLLFLRLLFIVPLVLVLLLVVVAQTGLAGVLIIPSIEKELGVNIDAGSVSINRSGMLVLDNVTIRAPDVEGPGGELGSVRRITADVDWGNARVRSITLQSPNVRLSEDTDTGVVNFSSFRLPSSPDVGGPMTLPSVRVEAGSIELAEHTKHSVRVLKRLNIDGALLPEGDDAYKIALAQKGTRAGIDLSGTIDRLGVEVMLSGLSLDEWGPSSVPGRLRPFVEMLDVKGEISNTTFSMSSSGTVTAAVHLNGVAITLPIDMNETSGAGRMRMTEVSGAISMRDDEFFAEISGLLEDVPYEVELTYEGLTADAPFHGSFKVRGYNMATNPDIVPFLPEEVGYRLQQFAGSSLMASSDDAPISPTAIVDASVTLWRGPPTPDGPAELDFRGNLSFTNGTAAYEVFPYPFQNMAGSVQFDRERIRIEEIRGISHTGATISASGLIEPIGPTASVNLQIDTVNVPLDEVLEEALGETRGGIVDELFDDRRYAQLVEQGLILTPERAGLLRDQRDRLEVELLRAERDNAAAAKLEQIRAQLSSTNSQLRTPVFMYRGKADLGIRLRREEGVVSHWSRHIEVRLPEAGVILKDFPLPIMARDVVVVLTEQTASLLRGSYRPIGGGSASLTGTAALRTPEGDAAFRPAIRVQADRVPMGELLSFAIGPPELEGENPEVSADRRVAAELIERLGASGTFAADGLVLTRPNGKMGFDLEITPDNVVLASEPLRDRAPMLVGDLSGTLRVTERGLSMNASARAYGVDDDESLETPVAVRVTADIDWSGHEGLKYEANVEADDALLQLPAEQVVAAITRAGGDSLVWLRDTFNPSGKADIRAWLMSDGRQPVSDVLVTNIESVEADYLGGRLELREVEGEGHAVLGAFRTLSTDALSGELFFEGEHAGHAEIAGTLGIDETGEDPSRELTIDLTGGRFDSTLAERIVRDVVGGAVAKEYLEHGVRGGFDAVVSMTAPRPAIGGVPNEGVARIAFVETTIEPKWAELTRLGATVSLGDMTGRLVASKQSARFEKITGVSDKVSVSLSGGATPDGSGGTIADVTFDFDASSLSKEVRAVLPVEVLAVLDASLVEVNGAIGARGARLRTHKPAESETAQVEFSGLLTFDDASLTAGARVERASGRLQIAFSKPLDGIPDYEMEILADSASVLGLPMEHARAVVRSSGELRGVLVPVIFAESCGGVISGTASVHPAGDWAGKDQRSYESLLTFSGLRLNEAIDGVASARSGVSKEPRRDTGARLVGEISLGGLVGRDETRRGRLDLRIAGGNVIDVPGAIRLVEASNLQMPAGEGIDFASVEAVFDGGQIAIEGMSLISSSVELLGFGTATWPELELDLRLRSRATRRIPVLSELLESIRDEFVTIAVTGTAAEPKVSVQSLPETRRVIGRVLGFDESAGDRRLSDLEARAEKQRRLRGER
ncbi:MAG: hypothetical protein KDA31_00965 [Phycisphaerales bacterium]|nr:hypothetical protein [Phycisphaerales bacterium]